MNEPAMNQEEHFKMAREMKARLKVDELEENIDELEEVVEGVFPILIITVVVSFFILFLFCLRMYMRYSVDNPSKNRMDGKTVLITGATSGIGKATAIELAKRNARVFILGRDKDKTEAVARNIRKKTSNQHVNAVCADLGNLRSIREFADEFNKNEKTLHVLINNAAYMGPKATTQDGLEKSFGVNYLGHFYLTHLLVDKLKKCAPSRIINVVSDAYTIGKLDLDDLALNNSKYLQFTAYARSKLAQVIFNAESHRRHFPSCVWTFGVHPGAVATELSRNFVGLYGKFFRAMSRIMFKSPEDGCQTIVYCAVADGLRDFSGKVFTNCKVMKTTDVVKDKELARRLWGVSAQLCGFECDEPADEGTSATTANGADVCQDEKKDQ